MFNLLASQVLQILFVRASNNLKLLKFWIILTWTYLLVFLNSKQEVTSIGIRIKSRVRCVCSVKFLATRNKLYQLRAKSKFC